VRAAGCVCAASGAVAALAGMGSAQKAPFERGAARPPRPVEAGVILRAGLRGPEEFEGR